MVIKTRHQRLQEAESGAQPSPPHSLRDEPRAKRSRTNNSSSCSLSSQQTPSTQPSSSEQTSTLARASVSRRGGRSVQRGARGKARAKPIARSQPQIHEDAAEASDSSTRFEVPADADASVQVTTITTQVMEDENGETPSHSALRATHPVFAGTPRMDIVKDGDGEIRTPRPGSGATRAVYSATSSPIGAQPMEGKRSPSETSEWFRQILTPKWSPVTPITSLEPAGEVQEFLSHAEAAQNHLDLASPVAGSPPVPRPSPSTGPPPSMGAQPAFQGSMATPPRPVMPKVYGLPSERHEHYSLMHILVDSLPSTRGKGLVSRQDPSIALAIPSSEIARYLVWASQNSPDLRHLMDHPVASSVINEHKLTPNVMLEIGRSRIFRKRKRTEDEAEATPETVAKREAEFKKMGKTMRHAFVNMAEQRRRAALKESTFQARSPEVEVSTPQSINVSGPADGPYNYDEVPDRQEQTLQRASADSQDQTEAEQAPETPRARGWGLSSFLPSVSRFIPFSSRRAPSTARVESRTTTEVQARPENTTTNEPSSQTDLSAHQQSSQHLRGAQTEPRHRNTASTARHDGQGPEATSALAQRVHREKPQRILFTKKQKEERQRLKQEKEQFRAEKERLAQEEARFAREKQEWEEQRMVATAAQTPGTKRKRVPSPETYPLPERGFGLVDAIFAHSSDEESSEEEQETPTRSRPNKKARISSSSMGVSGVSPSSQYEGSIFTGFGASTGGTPANIFAKRASPDTAAITTTPSGPSRNAFSVPSPTDSDPDEDRNAESPNATTGQSITDMQATSSQAAPSQSKSMPPPPTPNAGHAASHVSQTGVPLDPLEKAREKALRHQPKYGSRLRESSRLSTSTVGSDGATPSHEDDDHFDDSRYDPKRPAMLPPLSHASPAAQTNPLFVNQNSGTAKDTTTVRHGHAPYDGKGFSYDNYRKTMTPAVEAHIEVTWDEDGDDVLIGFGDTQFEAGYEAWKEEQKPQEAISFGAKAGSSSNEASQLSYAKADISAGVRALIDSNLTAEDEEMGVNDFDEAYEAWKAMEMQGQGALLPGITA